MEYRHLIGFGKSSYVVSIPKRWAAQHKLAKGDIITITQAGPDLILSATPPGRAAPRRITLQAENKPRRLLASEIITAYLNNYEVIEIKGADVTRDAPAIKRALHDLSGLELVEQTTTTLVAKDLLDLRDVHADTIIRRIDLIIRSMQQDALGSIHEDYSESIFHRDADVNRLVLLAQRIIRDAIRDPTVAKTIDASIMTLLRDWTLVHVLEHTGDTIKRIARVHRTIPLRGPPKAVRSLHATLCAAYNDALKAHHTVNPALAGIVELNTPERAALIEKTFAKSRTAEIARLANLYREFNTHISDAARAAMSA